MNDKPIEVLVVDDSKVARSLLIHLLESDPRIRLAGEARNGREALSFVEQKRPDVILMDIHMPVLDGFEATRRIMETQPVPIVICSATADPGEVATTFRLMEAGAVACVEKPVGPDHPDFAQRAANLIQTVKLMSEVRVVRRWPRARQPSAPAEPAETRRVFTGNALIGIGASTGGPPLLQMILANLPPDLPAPVLIVQHIARGFLSGLVEWLNQSTRWPVRVASHGTLPLPGHAYFAPDDLHMGINGSGCIALNRSDPENGLRPAVSHLFRSLSEKCGRNSIGVLLSGMGKDGAAELKLMRDRGAVTIAQDRETSVVYGMPGEAVELGAACHVLPADRIPGALISLLKGQHVIGGKKP